MYLEQLKRVCYTKPSIGYQIAQTASSLQHLQCPSHNKIPFSIVNCWLSHTNTFFAYAVVSKQ